jgi:peptidoglycan/LPS O-acetylase OafA/YrhL
LKIQAWLWPVCVIGGILAASAKIIARSSYGIYLTHMPLIWICFVRLRVISSGAQWLLFLTVTAGLPIVLYHVVEDPMIRLGKRLARSVR